MDDQLKGISSDGRRGRWMASHGEYGEGIVVLVSLGCTTLHNRYKLWSRSLLQNDSARRCTAALPQDPNLKATHIQFAFQNSTAYCDAQCSNMQSGRRHYYGLPSSVVVPERTQTDRSLLSRKGRPRQRPVMHTSRHALK